MTLAKRASLSSFVFLLIEVIFDKGTKPSLKIKNNLKLSNHCFKQNSIHSNRLALLSSSSSDSVSIFNTFRFLAPLR
jgi:hypothetical protein